jgi:very-short-patch-repair endonuclease/transposase-like protein
MLYNSDMSTNQVPKVCAHCGGSYSVKASQASRNRYCSKACKNAAQRTERQASIEKQYSKPIRDVLDDLYNQQQMGIKAIARLLGMSDHTLWEWFDQLGIPRRGRSEAVKGQWRNNEIRRAAWGQTISEWKHAHPADAMEHSLIGNLTLQNTSPTRIERALMDALAAAGIAYVFQFVVGDKFLCDFAFPAAMLIVECDGEYWHSTPKQRRRDTSKDAYLQACGYTVIRFSDKQIEHDVNACVAAIAAILRLDMLSSGNSGASGR